MSVYIKIKDAILNKRPSLPIYLLIQSSSATLKTIETPSSKNPFWQSQFICSIKQRYLHFRICLNNTNININRIPSSSFFQQLKQNNTYAVGQLPFEYFQLYPYRQYPLRLELVSQYNSQFSKQGYLQLVVYYQPNKNYIGEMEFYQFGQLTNNTNNNGYNNNKQFVYDDKNNQVSANNNVNSDIYAKHLKNKEKMEMYKGPCKTKNLFSCCDRPVNQQEYQLIQPHYFNS